MAASVADTMKAINDACHGRGGKYAEYSCKVVSWDDVSRGTNSDGSLSCWGANITDTYLKSKDGRQLFTVRSDNWNEKLGKVSSSEVALVAGDSGPKGELRPRLLKDVLRSLGQFGGYAGLEPTLDLSDERLDAECSIRFQTTFLPVTGERGSLEMATEAYNYNTMSDDDPRNLVLLCTTQGLAVQQDGAGAKKLFHHAVDEDDVIHRYWLEAERSKHKVGGQQKETADEKADALARGKATSSVIGVRAMGTRFNVLMTIQVPLQQVKPPDMHMLACESAGDMDEDYDYECEDDDLDGACCEEAETSAPKECKERSASPRAARNVGTSNAARVSRGSEVDTWDGLGITKPQRNPSEHVTITVVMYNTVADGVPSEEDVCAAIDDLEALYQACSVSGRLEDQEFDFMKKPLTDVDMGQIAAKLAFQPPSTAVIGGDAFPC